MKYEKITFPEGKIILTNGNEIKGYALEPHEGRESPSAAFFTDHAFLFLAHAKKILADSRMFLSRVPVDSGLAYMGQGGFKMPTLGIYLEWWTSCKDAVVEVDGQNWLVWRISGSPLSGMNSCGIINEKGEIRWHSIINFSRMYRSFMVINMRYSEVKTKYEWFTLDEVVKAIGDDDEEKRQALLDCFFLRYSNEKLAEWLKQSEEWRFEMREKLAEAMICLHKDELMDAYRKHQDLEAEREQLWEKRIALRKRLKVGELTNKQYQDAVHPINVKLSKFGPYHSRKDCTLSMKYPEVRISDFEKFIEEENMLKEKEQL